MTSTIEWTDRHDWNPVRGCTRVSPGCGGPGDHGGCYAEAMAARFSDPGQWGHGFAARTPKGGRWTGKVELIEERLTPPLRWAKGVPGRNKCFPTSTSDPFHESLPDETIDRLFAVMALRPDWIFQVLTKRSARMREYLSANETIGRVGTSIMSLRHTPLAISKGLGPNGLGPVGHIEPGREWWPLPNVWLGVSAEDQQRWDERTADLRETPAAIRWVSAEPLLGPIRDAFGMDGIDWVVTGGESGPHARPMNHDWVRSLRDQCQCSRAVPLPTAFFFKQWGSNPEGACKSPNGGRGGALLDGLAWREFPA